MLVGENEWGFMAGEFKLSEMATNGREERRHLQRLDGARNWLVFWAPS